MGYIQCPYFDRVGARVGVASTNIKAKKSCFVSETAFFFEINSFVIL